MVGKFGLGSIGLTSRNVRDASAPPPPQSQEESSNQAKDVARDHVGSSASHTTTSYFFSLPIWKRRGTNTLTPAARSSSDELGVVHRSLDACGPMRDKALPPTPSEIDLTTLRRAGSSKEGRGTSNFEVGERASADIGRASGPSSASQSSRSSPMLVQSTSQPTVALARAALGLGLPHVMPGSVSASSSTTDLHSIPIPPTPPESLSPHSTMRRAKSFHPDTEAPRRENIPSDRAQASRRTRGLSIGPFHFASNDKGKERAHDPDVDAGYMLPASKSLSRKNSFWSRKRVESQNSSPPSRLSSDPSLRPILPSIQPISPFYVDTIMPAHPPRSPGPPTPRSGDLRRRHSERTRFRTAKPDYFETPLPPDVPSQPSTSPEKRRVKRPKTADPAISARASFFHEVPRVVTSSPPPIEPLLPNHEESSLDSPPPPIPSATPSSARRPRAQTNPPLLHRLSVNLFGSSPTSSSHTPYIAPSPLYDTPTFTPDPLTASPSSSRDSSRPSLSNHSVEIPKPRLEDESPESYVDRLVEAVSKGEVATILASHADPFHAKGLRVYIERFKFNGDPLDVAVRKLLMDVGLPRETQQIDRVIEAFAARYMQCNPNLYMSDDQPYILAFSLIMLHTDAFNKHNKRKMTKADYMKNTRLVPPVPPEVLDYFYDNIVFAPFIFIEDPVDVNGPHVFAADISSSRRMSVYIPPTPGSTSTLLGKSNKIDPYYLITRDLLDDLRVNVTSSVPPENPYVYRGTGGPWDEEELLRAFTTAATIEISAENQYGTTPFFGLSVSGGPGPLQAPLSAGLSSMVPYGGISRVRVTKVGLLQRKDDANEGGRRAMNRKWREWCAVLTGSHLLFFRDLSLATSINEAISSSKGHVPQTPMPEPDEYISVKDCIAVFDRSYSKHPNTFRLVMSDRRHYLLQAHEKDVNEWISCINYASAFKTAGLRMRAPGMDYRDIELTGIAAAASHLREMQRRAVPVSPRVMTWYGGLDVDTQSPDLSSSPVAMTTSVSAPARKSSFSTQGSSTGRVSESSARLFKATFDEVKTELAASARWPLENANGKPIGRPRRLSLESTPRSPPMSQSPGSSDSSIRSSRSELIRRKLGDLEGRITQVQMELDADMRLARNLAVLTPFQRATRERVQAAVQGAAKRIMLARLELEKLVCHRDVLSYDLQAGERDWERTKRIALRAATDKLASQEAKPPPRPLTALSVRVNAEQSLASSPVSARHSAGVSTVSQGRDSSTGDESFHSAHSSIEGHDGGPAAFLDARGIQTFDTPMTSPLYASNAAGTEYPFPDVTGGTHANSIELRSPASERLSSQHGSEEGGHEKFYTAPEMQEEQAEEWNKTRAAKRVSLVKLPPDLRISVLFGKHGRTGSESISEATATAPSSPDMPEKRTHGRTMDTFTMLDM